MATQCPILATHPGAIAIMEAGLPILPLYTLKLMQYTASMMSIDRKIT